MHGQQNIKSYTFIVVFRQMLRVGIKPHMF